MVSGKLRGAVGVIVWFISWLFFAQPVVARQTAARVGPFFKAGGAAGLSIQEQSTNDGKFVAGFCGGPFVEFGPKWSLERSNLTATFRTGALFLTNQISRGTKTLEASTRYQRLDGTLGVSYFKHGFGIHGGGGLGLMVIHTEAHYEEQGVLSSTKHTGVMPGALVTIGGFAQIPSTPKGRVGGMTGLLVQWFRRGRRDEFFVLLDLSSIFVSSEK